MADTKKYRLVFEKVENPFKKFEDEEEKEKEDEGEGSENPFMMGKMMIMGSMPTSSFTDPAEKFDIILREYNLHNLHTNFYISDKIFSILDNTDGVEILELLTPYRARIVFGKAFDEMLVQKNIQKAMNDYLIKGIGRMEEQTLSKLVEDQSQSQLEPPQELT